jgi:hypothetical protein
VVNLLTCALACGPSAQPIDQSLFTRLREFNMRTDFMLLAIYNKPLLNLKEVCEAIGMSMKKRLPTSDLPTRFGPNVGGSAARGH